MIIEKIFNIETGEETIIEREETAQERKKKEELQAELAILEAKAKAQIAAKAILLERLGITEEEAKLLLG